jgi:N-acetylglucosaminyldiphosphoundecaprenol N-acetyl-beta-D-mannosaminyltransferase
LRRRRRRETHSLVELLQTCNKNDAKAVRTCVLGFYPTTFSDWNQMSQRTLMGVPLCGATIGTVVDRCREAIQGQSPQVVVACTNPHSLVVSRQDAEFRRALLDADIVLPDGVGVTLAGHLLRRNFGPRITGLDFFRAVLDSLGRQGQGRVAFFGSSPEVLKRLVARVSAEHPSVTVVAAISPPYGAWSEAEDARYLAALNAAKPDVVWVGMTAPRQEKWVLANRRHIEAPVIASVGAVFDYHAGTVRRAPEWVCHAGLEWLYRLAGEPRRLWRRTLVSAPQFMWFAMLEALQPWRSPH